jgi:hypothetical protein
MCTEEVELVPLDDAAAPYLRPNDRTFLKIDVQGYTSQVLDGAVNILGKALGVQVELSYIPLYDGEQLFGDVIARLSQLGFNLWQTLPGFTDSQTGRHLQCDGVFFRD